MIHRFSIDVETETPVLHIAPPVITETFCSDELTAVEVIEVGQSMILESVADWSETRCKLDELIVESAFGDQDQLLTICEAGSKLIFDKAKKLFERLVNVIGSILTKVTIYLTKLTNRTESWAKKIEPLIKEARKDNRNSSITYNMYDWDSEFVLNGIQSAASEIGAKYGGDNYGTEFARDLEKMRSGRVTVTDDQTVVTYKGDDNKDRAEIGRNTIRSSADETDDIALDVKKAARDAFKNILKGNKDTEDFQDILEAIVLHAHRGDNEKRERGFFSVADKMLEDVRNSKKTIAEIQSRYRTHMANMNAAKDAVQKASGSFSFKDDAEIADGQAATAATAMRNMLDHRVKQITAYYSANSSIMKLNMTCITNMVTDYMGALTALAKTVKTKTK